MSDSFRPEKDTKMTEEIIPNKGYPFENLSEEAFAKIEGLALLCMVGVAMILRTKRCGGGA